MENSFHVVINSCLGFYEIAARTLVNSLKSVGVPLSAIHVVVGESPEESDTQIEGIAHHFRRWCNIDNNGFLWLTQENHGLHGWVFYMHDTCLVVNGFWESCLRLVKEVFPHDISCVRLRTPVSMGMGFYKIEWLRTAQVVEALRNEINEDPSKKMDIKKDIHRLEDFVFHLAERDGKGCASLENKYTVVQQNVKMYGSETPRIIELYQVPGVLKIKANYMGLQTKWTTNL